MANTFIKIATVTVGSGGASTIDFSSIPGTYTDLCLKVSSRSARAATGTDWKIEFNGSTSGYKYRRAYGDGAAVYSDESTIAQIMTDSSANATASVFGSADIYIPNYASSAYKSLSSNTVSENNASGANSAYQNMYGGRWDNTAAITSISLKSVQSTTFAQYSTATLYGISKS